MEINWELIWLFFFGFCWNQIGYYYLEFGVKVFFGRCQLLGVWKYGKYGKYILVSFIDIWFDKLLVIWVMTNYHEYKII